MTMTVNRPPLRPPSQWEGKGMGRGYAPDVRDRQYPLEAAFLDVPKGKRLRAMKGTRAVAGLTKVWTIPAPTVIDQGGSSACTGFGPVQAWRASPRRWPKSHWIMQDATAYAHQVYKLNKERDEWPGENYDGSSVRAAMKSGQDLGIVASYLNTTDVDVTARHLHTIGPLVFGTIFTEGMAIATGGVMRVLGRDLGGHAYAVIGHSTKQRSASGHRILNSWGQPWGENGRAWLTDEDADYILRDQDGECYGFTETPVLPPVAKGML